MDIVKNFKEGRFLHLIHTFRENCTIIVCILEVYIFVPVFSTNSVFLFFGVADGLISFILKFYPLSRVNFLYWEANLPSNRVNLSRINFKYVN